MTENVRQRKRVDEVNYESTGDDSKRGIVIDPDDRRPRRQPSLPLS